MKFSGTMPDVTPAQIAVVAGWIAAQLVAYGVVDVRYQQLAISVGATVLGAVWKIADAVIRNGRAKALAVKATAPEPPVTTVTT